MNSCVSRLLLLRLNLGRAAFIPNCLHTKTNHKNVFLTYAKNNSVTLFFRVTPFQFPSEPGFFFFLVAHDSNGITGVCVHWVFYYGFEPDRANQNKLEQSNLHLKTKYGNVKYSVVKRYRVRGGKEPQQLSPGNCRPSLFRDNS